MSHNRKSYPESFKKKVAKEALESGKTMQEVAAENGVSPSQVCKWKQQMLEGGFSKELKKVQKELESTRKKLDAAMREIGKKELMLEIVKKKVNMKDEDFTI